MNQMIANFANQALAGQPLDRSQADLLAQLDGDDLYDLFYWANAVRLKSFGRTVTFCSIAAGKVGGCSEDCRFCAQSARYHTPIQANSRPTADQLLDSARQAAGNGARWFGVVNSGRSPAEQDLTAIADAYQRISESVKPLTLCASLGCLTAEQARRLVAMGVRRYNHNLETSRRFYSQIVTTHSFDDRLATLRAARDAGLELCCGGVFNLGETWGDRIDMAFTLRELAPAMVPLNFLSPIPGTPLGDRPPMPPMEILKVIAIYRLLLPATPIKLAGGREANLRDLQGWMFYCGATSSMVGNYLTTCGRPAAQDRQLADDLGLHVADEGEMQSAK